MGKKDKFNPTHKFTLFVKLSRRVPNSINISKFHSLSCFVYNHPMNIVRNCRRFRAGNVCIGGECEKAETEVVTLAAN